MGIAKHRLGDYRMLFDHVADLTFLIGYMITSDLFPQGIFFFSFIFISNLHFYTLFLTNSISLFISLFLSLSFAILSPFFIFCLSSFFTSYYFSLFHPFCLPSFFITSFHFHYLFFYFPSLLIVSHRLPSSLIVPHRLPSLLIA